MIFVTVGTQLHFDRMIEVVDRWAANSDDEVFCQTGPSQLHLKACAHREFLSPEEFSKHIEQSSILISHAGIGSIFSAMQYGKPIIIFPRKASLGEHRNEHQLATAKKFKDRKGIYVAFSEEQLLELLDRHKELSAAKDFSPFAEERLIITLNEFITS